MNRIRKSLRLTSYLAIYSRHYAQYTKIVLIRNQMEAKTTIFDLLDFEKRMMAVHVFQELTVAQRRVQQLMYQ